jgi:NAD(P)-dependent dehydrogenase (short-subunit alcohol dehydrogenase family)
VSRGAKATSGHRATPTAEPARTPSAIVTGGAQGIGKAIAAMLVQNDYHVVIVDRDAVAGKEATRELGTSQTDFIEGSAGDPRVIEKALKRALSRGPLRAAVANAGLSKFTPLEQLSLAEWNEILTVNLTGAFLLARTAAPELRNNRGAMVLMASTRAAQSEAGTLAYSASKGGIVALTHSLAISLGPEVRVNCVSPGWIATDAWQRSDRRKPPKLSKQDHAQHPVGRVGTPEDIAAAVRYLLSDAAGFVTGANFVIDGGMSRKMIYD